LPVEHSGGGEESMEPFGGETLPLRCRIKLWNTCGMRVLEMTCVPVLAFGNIYANCMHISADFRDDHRYVSNKLPRKRCKVPSEAIVQYTR